MRNSLRQEGENVFDSGGENVSEAGEFGSAGRSGGEEEFEGQESN